MAFRIASEISSGVSTPSNALQQEYTGGLEKISPHI
jgi:hypothetical protein